jgi:hypothetical protein
MRLKTATLGLVAASLIYFLAFPSASNQGSIALAEVKAQVERVRTVQYIETATSLDAPAAGTFSAKYPPGEDGPKVLRREIEALESRLSSATKAEKTDIQHRLKLLKPLLKADLQQLDRVQRVRIKGKRRQRTDDIFPYGFFHSVIDAESGNHVSYDHSRKTRSLHKTQVVLKRESGEKTEHKIAFSPAADFFQRFRQIPVEATKQLPRQKIDGVEAIGFRSVEKHDDGTWTRTYWVNPETKLPFKIVTVFKSSDKSVTSATWVQDQFVFDEELNDSLFATDTPAGYESKETKIYGFE